VLCETAVCFFEVAASGKYELAPIIAKKTPDVDRIVVPSPAKSASANKWGPSSEGLSPTHPDNRKSNVELI
jgi:hypothetical protein